MLTLFLGFDAALLDSVPASGLMAYFEQTSIIYFTKITFIDGALLFSFSFHLFIASCAS